LAQAAVTALVDLFEKLLHSLRAVPLKWIGANMHGSSPNKQAERAGKYRFLLSP